MTNRHGETIAIDTVKQCSRYREAMLHYLRTEYGHTND